MQSPFLFKLYPLVLAPTEDFLKLLLFKGWAMTFSGGNGLPGTLKALGLIF
jgi:hypothetical protein